MIHWLALLIESAGGPSLLRYVTTRSLGAFVTAFIVGLVCGRPIIHWLFRRGLRSTERSYGDIDPTSKQGTPVMGGVILWVAGAASAVVWSDLTSPFTWTLLAAMAWFTALGARDDILKVRGGDADAGLSRTVKFSAQIAFGVALGTFIVHPATSPLPAGMATELHVPFLKQPLLDLGWFYVPFVVFVIVAYTNAVNFADGMDGLAIVPAFFLLLVLGTFAYVLGNARLADYLLYPFLPGTAEVVVCCAAMGGAALSFLWFNAHPAEVFMGDTGSMMLGGLIGTCVVLLKQEVLGALAGGVFVAEVASVLVQDIGLRRGQRILTRAPLHHAFQYQGTAESKVVVRFWIMSAMLAAMALATLKIR